MCRRGGCDGLYRILAAILVGGASLLALASGDLLLLLAVLSAAAGLVLLALPRRTSRVTAQPAHGRAAAAHADRAVA